MFSNFGKAIKEFVMEDDSSATVAAVVAVAAPATSAPLVQSVVDNKYIEALRASIKARPTALTALTIAAEKLEFIPDANMRLKAAFQSVKSEGRGVKEILEAITVHAADLESQKLQFTRALETESETTVGRLQDHNLNLKSEVDSARLQIKSFESQIEKLNEIISKHSVTSNANSAQINDEKSRLARNAQQFEIALTVVKNELESQRVVIQSALS